MRPLNLASQPFRNERLPSLALSLALAALLALSAWQALTLRRLLPADGDTLRGEVAALDNRLETLEAEERELLGVRPTPQQVDEWLLVGGLVERRLFTWSALLGRLEQVLPPGVRLVSIAPAIEDGDAVLELSAVARSLEEGFELVRVLQQSGEFDRVIPRSMEVLDEGAAFSYSMRYRPRAAAADPAPEPEPAAEAPPAPPAPGVPAAEEHVD